MAMAAAAEEVRIINIFFKLMQKKLFLTVYFLINLLSISLETIEKGKKEER